MNFDSSCDFSFIQYIIKVDNRFQYFGILTLFQWMKYIFTAVHSLYVFGLKFQQEVTTMIKTLSSSLSDTDTHRNSVFEQVQGLFH